MSNQPCPPNEGICAAPDFNNPEWVSFSRNRLITAAEKGKKYTAANKNGECVAKVKVDGGLLSNSTGKKADYIVLRCDCNKVYILEFKGRHIDEACRQILSTIDEFSDVLDKCAIYARIISSRGTIPNLKSSHEYKLDILCRSKFGDLKVKAKDMKEIFQVDDPLQA